MAVSGTFEPRWAGSGEIEFYEISVSDPKTPGERTVNREQLIDYARCLVQALRRLDFDTTASRSMLRADSHSAISANLMWLVRQLDGDETFNALADAIPARDIALLSGAYANTLKNHGVEK